MSDPCTDGATRPDSALALLRELNQQFASDHDQGPAGALPGGELKSTRLLRSTLSQLGADRRLAKALEQAPEESGPLNPQMLAIRSLATMQDISPRYLQRFISYVDTLFWLEQAGDDSGA